MRTLLKNGNVINVFTESTSLQDVLIDNDRIVGVGKYEEKDADNVIDCSGKYICPGFIDGHIHIESTMLIPSELAKVALPHGTTAIVADPHEIANVCGTDGIEYMLQMSEGVPMQVYIMLPSCVPATPFDESGATLYSFDLKDFYSRKRVLGLAEMMNYPGVINQNDDVLQKLDDAFNNDRFADGHAPMIVGHALDKYLSARIHTDHECSGYDEALEKLSKGQWILIREGTAARNLEDLQGLIEAPYYTRCVFATDDRHPMDIINEGHIDNILRKAIALGKKPERVIRMASLQAAECFGIKYVGAIAPGYQADINIMDNLENISITDVFCKGQHIVEDGMVGLLDRPEASENITKRVVDSFNLKKLTASDFAINHKKGKCRVISVIPGQLFTDEIIEEIDPAIKGGIDIDRDICKLAVIERHKNTGHKGIGYIKGIGIKSGAIASSVSHDSHNLIVIGTSDSEMAAAANAVIEMGGGNVVVDGGVVIASMPLPIAGLMTDVDAVSISKFNEEVRKAAHDLGAPETIEPFMNMAFVSLPVIPNLKMSTKGLVDVVTMRWTNLFLEDDN